MSLKSLSASLALPALLAACASTPAVTGPRAPARFPDVRTAALVSTPGSRAERVRGAVAQNVRVLLVENGTPLRSASGVVVGNARTSHGSVSYVMTNAHVVAPREGEKANLLVLVEMPTGETQEFVAELGPVGSVPDEDLAVLSVPSVALEPARLAQDEELAVGEDVFVVAAPYGHALSVSGGMLSQITYEKDLRSPALLKTDAAIGYGASGGGLFSRETGKLLGLVEGYRTAKVTIPMVPQSYSFDVPMPGETFASPAGKLRRFLERHGLGSVLSEQQGVAAPPVSASR